MPTDDTAVILYRLDALKQAQETDKAETRAQIANLLTHIDEQFRGVGGRIDKLEFVPKGTYEAQRQADRDYMHETRRIAVQARSVSVTVLLALAGLIAVITKVAA